MLTKKNKLVAKAKAYADKGQYEKALAEYWKLLGEDLPDTQTATEIIDLHARAGKLEDAAEFALKFARRYSDAGSHLKAVAICKKTLEVDPNAKGIGEHLAGAYVDLGLTSEALVQLGGLADYYEEKGESEALNRALLKMIEIDPSNTAVRLRLAKVLSKGNRSDEAAKHFEVAAVELKRQRRWDEFLDVSEQLMKLTPGRADIARGTAEIYLERKDYMRALAMLQICFADNPRDVSTLDMLATAFIGLEQADKAVSVYKQICLILDRDKDEDMRKTYLEIILELDPNNEFARGELGFLW